MRKIGYNPDNITLIIETVISTLGNMYDELNVNSEKIIFEINNGFIFLNS